MVYWVASARTHHGGFWLGDDRNALLTWEGGRVVSFLDHRVTPDLREAARRVREEFRYEGAPVVPLGRPQHGNELAELRAIPGAVELDFSDGWDEGCGHESRGSVLVAPGRRVLFWSHLIQGPRLLSRILAEC